MFSIKNMNQSNIVTPLHSPDPVDQTSARPKIMTGSPSWSPT